MAHPFHEHTTVPSILRGLDQQPILWRGLTGEELIKVSAFSILIGFPASLLVFGLLIHWLVGVVIGIALPIPCVLIAAKVLSRMKETADTDLVWVRIQKKLQRIGLGNYGHFIDKERWGIARTENSEVK